MQMYPKASLMFTGHSLGGAVAALSTSLKYNSIPAVTFESPPALLFAKRISKEGDDVQLRQFPIWNYGLSSDPIFTGKCNGIASSCYHAGYAMESTCHIGKVCTIVTNDRSDIRNHRIDSVINEFYVRNTLPLCELPKNCTDCQNYSFIP